MHITLRAIIIAASVVSAAGPVRAQEAAPDRSDQAPRGWIVSATPGVLREPTLMSRVVMSTESLSGGAPRDGFYLQTGSLITGGGWISGGPGYRRAVFGGHARIDAAAALSWNLYKSLRASFELPDLAHGRLSLGTGVSYQDALQVKYSGIGNETPEGNRSVYRFHNADLFGIARLQVNRWLSIDGRAGWIPQPTLSTATGPMVRDPNTLDVFSEATAPGLTSQPAFLHADASIVADSRDQAGHPTTGGMYRAGAAAYSDRDGGTYSFRRYEIEGAQYIPLGTRKWVLALHAWEVFSDTDDGKLVPFYLMPSLGGHNTLRGYADYRFHDNNLQNLTVESRLALLTHMDVAVFADAGKVAAAPSDLDFRHLKTSYGAGIRLHSARTTLVRIDAGHGTEGWRVFLKLSGSFKRTTPAFGRASVVPFVP